jgi:UDPglucose 6-dehydrogenase
MAQIAVIGAGYVGLTTAACFAHLGHDVTCADIDEGRVTQLSRGDVPIVEAGLENLVREGLEGGRLRFVVGAHNAANTAEFAYLCVPTPQADDGSADLSYIETAARQIGPVLPAEAVVVNKSTVPVGSTRAVERVLGREDVTVVSNPEFLREGSAVHDFLHPDRIVIGSEHQSAAVRVAALYIGVTAPIIVTDPASAETIKYASNAFLATKISFVNAIAAVCEAVGADVKDVVLGMGYDKRIGHEFLRPGPGWGGSCFLGHETLLVERDDAFRLLTFEDLADEVARHGLSGWRVLSWRPEDVEPALLPIGAVTRRPYQGTVVEVGTKMGRSVTVTEDHPFVVGDGISGGVVDVKSADALTLGDWLPVAQGSPEGLAPRPRRGRLLDASMSAEGARAGTATNGTYVPVHLDLDPAFWQVVGLYLAEGHRSVDGQRHRLQWSFNPETEWWLAEHVASYWRGHGVKVDVRRMTTTVAVTISSRLLATWMTDVLELGHNCYTKRLPDLVWGLSWDEKQALLQGLWWGDGSWSYINGGPSVILEYGTVSRELADGMLRLLGELGIMASLRVGRTTGSTTDAYFLRISGAEQVEQALFLVPDVHHPEILESVGRQAKRIAPTGYRALSKHASWVRVTSLRRARYEGEVFSIEVPDAGTVVTTGGLVVHNCFPKDSRALVHIAESSGYPFELLRGVIAVNDEQFHRVVTKVREMAGGRLDGVKVAVWGLTFKARTDDTRDSPALRIIELLRAEGALVGAYDPAVKASLNGVDPANDPYSVCEEAEVLAVLTEWDEFRWVDFEKVAHLMATPRVVDARNLLDKPALERRGFAYVGIGR